MEYVATLDQTGLADRRGAFSAGRGSAVLAALAALVLERSDVSVEHGTGIGSQ
jgi:hypothetical protein